MINCQRLLYSHGCKILGLIIEHEYSKDAKIEQQKKRVILPIEVGVKGITILVVLINLNNFETSVQN